MSLLFTLFLAAPAFSQEVFNLRNPSFEGKPGPGTTPGFWRSVGSNNESPPDIQPGQFGVQTRPHHGETYLSMVVRDNETWETISQKLSGGMLRKDSIYAFSLWLARPTNFVSLSRLTGEETSYTRAVVLRIWGYNHATEQEELLAETDPVAHTEWLRYDFSLKPTQDDFDEIELAAYYEDDKAPAYNGGVLVDDCSAIVKQ